MQKMTPRQLKIAEEIAKNFGDAKKYKSFCKHQDQRITDFYTDGLVNAQDEVGNTLLHYMCRAGELSQDFKPKVARAFYKAFEYAPNPMIKNNNDQTPHDFLQSQWRTAGNGNYCADFINSLLERYEKKYENNRLKRLEDKLDETQYALLCLLQGLQAITRAEHPKPNNVINMAHENWFNAIQCLKSRERE